MIDSEGNLDHLKAALADRYAIEGELGHGGMATVYRARDLRHNRDVAIKVLRPEYAVLIGAERFLREIQVTAHLQHPHILALIDSGRVSAILYYVMPCVDGESLRDRIERERQLPIEDAVRIGIEVAGALDYAHRQGVIHRDIKPENVLLHDGHALVSDFGIALECESGDTRLTETGLSIGTPGYMSPEQALGERQLDARSDIYGVGAMLYEMLTGSPPFTGATAQAIVARVLTAKPVPPSRLRKDIPASVESAILVALAREPGGRFTSGAALRAALTPAIASHRRTNIGALGVVVGAVVLAAIVFGVYRVRTAGAPEPPAIALLHSVTAVSDSARDNVLSSGISDEVYAALTSLPGIVVRGSRLLVRSDDPERGFAAIADSLGATKLVVLQIGHSGGALRVTAELYDVRHRQAEWVQTYTRAVSNDLNAIEDSIPSNISSQLRLKLSPAQSVAFRSGRTASPAAHDLLVLAKGYVANRGQNPTELDTAITLIRSAIAIDSNYAQAWAALAGAIGLRAVFGVQSSAVADFDSAQTAVNRALLLDSNSADGHTTLGYLKVFHQRDYAGAGREFARSVAIDSNRANTWLFRAWYYVAANQMDSAVASVRHAERLDPLDPVIANRLGSVYYMAEQNGAAESQLEGLLRRQATNIAALAELAFVYANDGQCAKTDQLGVRIDSILHGTRPVVAYAAAALALCHGASDAVRQLLALAKRQGDDGFWIGVIRAAMHDDAGVREALERGAREQSWAMFWVRDWPLFAPYRKESWFQQLEIAMRLLPADPRSER